MRGAAGFVWALALFACLGRLFLAFPVVLLSFCMALAFFDVHTPLLMALRVCGFVQQGLCARAVESESVRDMTCEGEMVALERPWL